ncbi:hypothetical protein ACRXCV_12335 [Halobacteriovorax sp. GFR7]|uniref:hypothetical protein n=1 Tax=unclassified Halobacteriovorax TaxID=2639665 RepID=UPI003D95BD15
MNRTNVELILTSEKAMSALKNLEDYIADPKLFESIQLFDDSSYSLHWSNWSKLICAMKERHLNGDSSMSIEEVKEELETFKEIPVWLVNKKGEMETTLFDLYNFYIDPRLKHLWFDVNKQTLISLKHKAGPFMHLHSMRWVDYDIYKLFVYDRLLNNLSLSHRDFRMNTNLKAKFSFWNSILKPVDGQIVQLSRKGILVSIEGHKNFLSLSQSDQISLSAEVGGLLSATGKRFEEFDEVIGNCTKAKSVKIDFDENIFKDLNALETCKGETYYMFIPFAKFPIKHHRIGKAIQHVIDEVEGAASDILNNLIA